MKRTVTINWVGTERAFFFGEIRLESTKHHEVIKEVRRLLGGKPVHAVFNFH